MKKAVATTFASLILFVGVTAPADAGTRVGKEKPAVVQVDNGAHTDGTRVG